MPRDIEAGRASVQLLLKNSKFLSGLKRSGERLKSFGRGAAVVGAAVTAAGGMIVGTMLGAVRHFASVGDTLDKMSKRTGVSAAALAELGFAAEQSGTDMGVVEKGFKGLSSALYDAEAGSKKSVDALSDIGMTFKDLKGLKPEDQFQQVADGIAKVEDVSRRGAIAQTLLGRAGRQLLPMLKDMSALRQEARDLGLVPSDEAVADAANVTDAFNRIRRAVGATFFEIGSALAPMVLSVTKTIQQVVVTIGAWVRDNKALVITIAKIGLAVMAAGAAISALGMAIIGIGFTLSSLATILATIKLAFMLLLSPIGAITAALAAGAFFWFSYTDSGRRALGDLRGALFEIRDTALATFQGISDALAAGDLALAGQIAMAGLKLAFNQGISGLNKVWQDWKAFFLTTANEASMNVAGAFVTAWVNIKAAWLHVKDFFMDLWESITAGAVKAWRNAQNIAGNGLLSVLEKFGVLSEEEAQWAREDLHGQTSGKNAATDQARDQAIVKREEERKAALASLDEEKKAALQSIEDQRKQRNADIEGGRVSNLASDSGELKRLQDELATLRVRAASAAADAESKRTDASAQVAAAVPEAESTKRQVFSTFSAAALQAQGSGPMDKVAKGIDRMSQGIDRMAERLEKKLTDQTKIDENMLTELRTGGMLA